RLEKILLAKSCLGIEAARTKIILEDIEPKAGRLQRLEDESDESCQNYAAEPASGMLDRHARELDGLSRAARKDARADGRPRFPSHDQDAPVRVVELGTVLLDGRGMDEAGIVGPNLQSPDEGEIRLAGRAQHQPVRWFQPHCLSVHGDAKPCPR